MTTSHRFQPADAQLINRLYSLYRRCHGAEFTEEQTALVQMAEANARLAWLDRVEKGLRQVSSTREPTVDNDEAASGLTDQFQRLGQLRASALRQFDSAFARFAAIRGVRNQVPEGHWEERISPPERTLISFPSLTALSPPQPETTSCTRCS